MRHSDFQIGMEFFTGAGKWRCTDVGTRVVVAISLAPRAFTLVRRSEGGDRTEERLFSEDPRDLAGPPYLVAEQVFDEYDLDGCYATADDIGTEESDLLSQQAAAGGA